MYGNSIPEDAPLFDCPNLQTSCKLSYQNAKVFTFRDTADFTATLTFLAHTLTAVLAENQPYFLKASKPTTLMEAGYSSDDFLWDSCNSITSILTQNGSF